MEASIRSEYWRENPVRLQSFDGLDPNEEDLVLAVYAQAIANGGPAPELMEQVIGFASQPHRIHMAKWLEPDRVDRERLKMTEQEKHPVSDPARASLRRNYETIYVPLISEGQIVGGNRHSSSVL